MPVDLSAIEASQKQTQADLKAVGDQIKTYAERTEKEIKASGEMQAETRGKVDELLMKQGELQARMQDAEQKLVNTGKQHEPEVQQSAGALVSAKGGRRRRHQLVSRFSSRRSTPRCNHFSADFWWRVGPA